MSGEENLPSEDDLEKLPDPDTDSATEKFPVMEAIPVADEAASAPPAAAPAPEGPRVFPQQYTMLFANMCILAGTLTVWERQGVTGHADLYGFTSIGGAFVMAVSAYCVLVGLVGLVRGGMRLGSSLLSSFFALYFGIKSLLALTRHEGFQTYYDIYDKLGKSHKLTIDAFLAQFGPGIYLNLFGGAVILCMFIKAMFPKKKAEPAPRRRR